MAHGTGHYRIPLTDKDIVIENHLIRFYQTKSYYYEPMSDSYEPNAEWLDEYMVSINQLYPSKRFGYRFGEDIVNVHGDKNMANMIWYNLTHRQMSAEEVIEALKKLA